MSKTCILIQIVIVGHTGISHHWHCEELIGPSNTQSIDLQSEKQRKDIPSATSIPYLKCAIPLSKRWHNSGGNLFICYANWCTFNSWKVRHKERWVWYPMRIRSRLPNGPLNSAWVIPSTQKRTHVRTPTGRAFYRRTTGMLGLFDVLRDWMNIMRPASTCCSERRLLHIMYLHYKAQSINLVNIQLESFHVR